MARVIWSRAALRDLRSIETYIAQHNSRAARGMAEKLHVAADSLRDFPDRGRPAPRDMRELVSIWPYIIRYQVVGDNVFIVGIRHMRRRKQAR